MGCMFSKQTDNPRLFKVSNVDDNGQEMCPGFIEITDNELLLRQKGKQTIRWPLRSLRRYGFDAELFSFESGRRCPTGPGIYAFKCRRAEALFNLLQECIQKAGQEEQSTPYHRESDISTSGPPLVFQRMHNSEAETGTYINVNNEPEFSATVQNGISHHHHLPGGGASSNSSRNGGGNRNLRALASNGPTLADLQNPSSSGVRYAELCMPSNDPLDHYKIPNNNSCVHQNCGMAHHDVEPDGDAFSSQGTYINMPTTMGPGDQPPEGAAAASGEPCTGLSSLQKQQVCRRKSSTTADDPQRCYANIDVGPAAGLLPQQRKLHEMRGCKMNYIQLDLNNSSDNLSVAEKGANPSPTSPVSVNSSIPESPSRAKAAATTESYATIDFHKTAALNSANNSTHEDDCYRKTRHDSTIEELN